MKNKRRDREDLIDHLKFFVIETGILYRSGRISSTEALRRIASARAMRQKGISWT